MALAGCGAMVFLVGLALGQPPPGKVKEPKIKEPKVKESPPAPDVEREILKELKEAYKAPFEVNEDVLKELRRSYEKPSPEREAKISQ